MAGKERFLHRISGGADVPQNHEDGRFVLAPIQEMNLDNPVETGTIVRFLNHPANREHFTNPPTTVEELRRMFGSTGVHPLIARNMQGEIVGGAVIFDAQPTEHDHVLRFVVIDPRMQNRGLGGQMLPQVIDWAFTYSTSDGRVRTKLDTNIVEGVRGWERMRSLLRKLQFEFRMWLPEQVDVFDRRQGEIITRPTERWELLRSKWTAIRSSSSSADPSSDSGTIN